MKKIFGFLGFMFVCFFLSGTVFAQDIAQAVVKIYTVYNSYDYFEPWQMIGQRTKTGSGCVIEGKRILTNAHVVADQTFIQVRKSGDANKYIAKVEMVAHECDLAILMVEDEKFFDGIVPLALGELAKVRDKVAVYGFPKGGDRLSITEGVVSRVEHQEYTHSNANLLTCQIDAAINPGSSGGPVIKDGKIVGVAFQAGEGENIGYMVPAPIVRHFLSDIKDKKYDGTPELGVQWEKMENPDLRENYGMKDEQTGVLITDVYSGSSADGNLKIGDVVLSVDNIDIASDGTIEFRKGERTFWGYVFQNKYIGDSINFKILRDKK
ncbi:S1C family serine protease, partial [bacterium]|nr:S1C family serine protease [bacterium]